MARSDSGFGSLLGVRFLTVVNDNLLRWLAIGLGKYAAGAAGTALVLTIGTAGFVLPFVVLAWLAGWLADRFPKPRVIAWCKFAEVVIVAVAAAVLWWNARDGGSFAGWSRLWPAALALVGVAAAGWLASLMLATRPAADPAAPPPWNAISRTWTDLTELVRTRELAVSAAGIVFFWALGAVTQLNVDQYVTEAGGVSQGQAVPLLVALVIGIGAGSVVAGRLSFRSTDLGFVPVGAGIMAVASLGLACGPATILGPQASGWGWWFAIGMLTLLGFGAGMFDVPLEAFFQALSPPARRGSLLAALNLLTFAGMLAASLLYGLLRSPTNEPAAGLPLGLWLLLGTVILIGCQAAIMAPAIVGSIVETVPAAGIANANGIFALVTLVATLVGMAAGNWLADQPPPAAAAAVVPLVSARGMFGIFAALSAIAAVVTVCCAPRASLRVFVAAIVHAIWRYRVRGGEHVPAEGPVVVVANHLSWLDGFLLPLSCQRPLRMVVYGPNIQGRFLRMLADQWRFILFDPRPKSIGQALKTIQVGLAAGDAVGIFCEGGISRTGQLLGFKRGLEWLLERVEAPIMPASIDGMWGSLLSFSEGRYFTKRTRLWRRPLTLTFGRPLPVGAHPNQARLALQELAATAVSRRLDPAAATAEAFDGCCLLRRDDQLLASLAPGDPLHESLGTQAGRLLGIEAHVVEPASPAAGIVETLRSTRTTIWLARVEQVAAVAAVPAAAGLAPQLVAVVMPIASAADLPAARAAAEAFRAACGVEPVVAYAPRDVGGLVAMNTPAARHASEFEVTCKPETMGRVVNGVVVWPRAAMRAPLERESLAARGIPDDAEGTLVVAATAAAGHDGRGGREPGAALLDDAFDVDADGFLVPRA